jgi:hypothetical protein
MVDSKTKVIVAPLRSRTQRAPRLPGSSGRRQQTIPETDPRNDPLVVLRSRARSVHHAAAVDVAPRRSGQHHVASDRPHWRAAFTMDNLDRRPVPRGNRHARREERGALRARSFQGVSDEAS